MEVDKEVGSEVGREVDREVGREVGVGEYRQRQMGRWQALPAEHSKKRLSSNHFFQRDTSHALPARQAPFACAHDQVHQHPQQHRQDPRDIQAGEAVHLKQQRPMTQPVALAYLEGELKEVLNDVLKGVYLKEVPEEVRKGVLNKVQLEKVLEEVLEEILECALGGVLEGVLWEGLEEEPEEVDLREGKERSDVVGGS